MLGMEMHKRESISHFIWSDTISCTITGTTSGYATRGRLMEIQGEIQMDVPDKEQPRAPVYDMSRGCWSRWSGQRCRVLLPCERIAW